MRAVVKETARLRLFGWQKSKSSPSRNEPCQGCGERVRLYAPNLGRKSSIETPTNSALNLRLSIQDETPLTQNERTLIMNTRTTRVFTRALLFPTLLVAFAATAFAQATTGTVNMNA